MRSLQFTVHLCASLLAPLLLIACQGTTPQSQTQAAVDTSGIDSICSEEWLLYHIEQNGEILSLVDDSVISFQCTLEGRVAGSASVNRYFGSFTFDEQGQLIWPNPGFGSTMMAGPPALMEQEQRYLQTLTETRRMDLENGDLVLSNADNATVLRFRRDRETQDQ